MRALTNRYDLSFGVYIYACPLQQVIVGEWPQTSAEVQILIAILAVMPLALASWVFVERPALAKREGIAATLHRLCAMLKTPAPSTVRAAPARSESNSRR